MMFKTAYELIINIKQRGSAARSGDADDAACSFDFDPNAVCSYSDEAPQRDLCKRVASKNAFHGSGSKLI
jgi:hypothetical protein